MVTLQVLSICEVWGARAEIQVSRKELYTHINLDLVRVEFLSCIKKEKAFRLI